LHAFTLIAPVPCARTFLATVFSARGLRARTIGSKAGFNAVPQPSHCAASGVAGAVIGTSIAATPTESVLVAYVPPFSAVDCAALPPKRLVPTTARSAPASLSIAFPTSWDLGNPD